MNEMYLVSVQDIECGFNIGICSTLNKAKELVKERFGFPIRSDFNDEVIKKGRSYGWVGWNANYKQVFSYYDAEGKYVEYSILTDKKYKIPSGTVCIEKLEIDVLNDRGED